MVTFNASPLGLNPYAQTYAAPTAAPTPEQLTAQMAQLQQQLQRLEAEITALMAAVGTPAPAPAVVAPAPAPAPAPTVAPQGFQLFNPSPTLNPKPVFDVARRFFDWLSSWNTPPVTQPTQPGQPTPGQTPPPRTPGRATEFVISSFNVLGSSHTVPGRSERPGMDTGVVRIRRAVQLLDAHKVSVAGLQEFQPDQVKEFNKIAGKRYDVYPGLKLGKGPNVNSIVWRKDTWDLVKAETIPIPYFKGKLVKMPIVRLRNKVTGQEAIFTNFHNPASTKKQGNHEKWRDVATDKEIAMVNRLLKDTGLPVFVMGDMNERDEYYHRMTKGAPMTAANTGPKGQAPKKMGIDWIFGSKGVKFSNFQSDRSDFVKMTSDHPMIVSRARIGG